MFQAECNLLLGTYYTLFIVPSMLREIEFAYRVARMNGGATARAIFEMALRGRRLADPDRSCAIQVGERADLVVFDLPGGSSGFASLMRASASDVSLVVSAGRTWPAQSDAIPKSKRRLRS